MITIKIRRTPHARRRSRATTDEPVAAIEGNATMVTMVVTASPRIRSRWLLESAFTNADQFSWQKSKHQVIAIVV